jgi:hypothetical protein
MPLSRHRWSIDVVFRAQAKWPAGLLGPMRKLGPYNRDPRHLKIVRRGR